MSKKIDRTLPFVFAPTCKVVAINYPENPYHPGCLEFCGDYWEHLLTEFFRQDRFSRFIEGIDTENGMTAKAIEINFAYSTPDDIIQDICEEAVRYMSEKVKPQLSSGDYVVINSKRNEMKDWNGKAATVIGLDEENDIDDNGFKYLLRDKDGNMLTAYECELS